MGTITSRRWIERQIFAPYAEYQVEWPQGWGTSWVAEADLVAVDDGEGERHGLSDHGVPEAGP